MAIPLVAPATLPIVLPVFRPTFSVSMRDELQCGQRCTASFDEVLAALCAFGGA
ncbi:hypothetical protein C7S15_5467 [Burkholderia cepacia]|nr:hypothetical protein [Burkholderia cepacia]